MTFAAPFFAWVAASVALATVALHLLAWRRPPETPLPTARFAPERPIRLVSRAVRPSDLGLLALRVLLVLLVGFALAGPVITPRREGFARVVVVDRSRSVAGDAVATAARAELRAGDALVVFDSSAREVVPAVVDSLMAPPSQAGGSLSAALVVASRVARRLARVHDSVAVVVVSPFTVDELDAATSSIRDSWPGSVRLVRAGVPPNDTLAAARPQLRASAGDPVAVAIGLVGAIGGGGGVRVVRDAVTSADSAWARDGNALVVWPTTAPGDWHRRSAPDTSFGVATVGETRATVVAAFTRRVDPPAGHVIARWSDGDPAVTETALGTGCARAVSVPAPATGDLVLTPAFRRFVESVAAPCERFGNLVPASDTALATALPATVASRGESVPNLSPAAQPPRSLTAWLLGLALAAAVAEMFLRRGGSHAAA